MHRTTMWVGLGALVAVLVGAGSALAAPQSAEGALDRGEPRVRAELLADVTRARAGEPFTVGVRLQLDPGWHVYWKNPGDSGLPTEVTFQADQVAFGPLQWPFPSIFRSADGFVTSYGYAEDVVLWAEARPAPEAAGALRVRAKADVLVCEISCLPGQFELELPLPLGPESALDPSARVHFDRAASSVPQPLEAAGLSARFEQDPSDTRGLSGRVVLARKGGGTLPAVEGDFFVPEAVDGYEKVLLTPEREQPGHFRLSAARTPDAPKEAPRLRGALRLGTARTGFQSLALDVPLPLVAAAPAPVAAAAAPTAPSRAALAAPAPVAAPMSFGLMLLFAFLGGALLNLMPCVFPVLALKAYGFTRMVHEEKGRVGTHALAYALGILGTMLALALVVVGVRAAGTSVGWGFQFQEPLFVAAVCALLVAFSLNLFGVFHVGLGDAAALTGKVDHAHGAWRSAGEGVLAVVLATPCSAPLLGSAVGFALASGPFTTVLVFLVLGLGLALPFCVLVLVPGLAQRLPRPGAWMERFKQLLGFALLGTVAWLAWVMGGLAGVDGVGRLLGFLVAVGVACWVWGAAQGSRARWLGALGAAALLALAGAWALRFESGAAGAGGTLARAPGLHGARPWDEAAVRKALAEGRPAFVDLTADWCLTCKFNERTVLATPSVKRLFERHDVAVFVGDWTRRDAAIGALLARHGKAGVPLYLVFHPQRPDAPEVLPELLTEDLVRQALERARPASAPSAKET